jgi:hypothetical protein
MPRPSDELTACIFTVKKDYYSTLKMEALFHQNVSKIPLDYVGSEVLTAVVMKSTIFWDITPCSPLSVNRRFGGTYRLHLHGRKNKLGKEPA